VIHRAVESALGEDLPHQFGDAIGGRRIVAIRQGEFFPNRNAKNRGFTKPSSHTALAEWLARRRFSIGNLYDKEAR
jgi:hypothetical protein